MLYISAEIKLYMNLDVEERLPGGKGLAFEKLLFLLL